MPAFGGRCDPARSGSKQWMLWAEAKQMAALDTYAADLTRGEPRPVHITLIATCRVYNLIEPAKAWPALSQRPYTAWPDIGARCALNKTEGPLIWSQGPHYGTLGGTVTVSPACTLASVGQGALPLI